jgi:phosphopantetheine adenylyltransferase
MKKPFLSFDERFQAISSVLSKMDISLKNKVLVEKIIGNTADFIYKKNAICIRGIRNIDDLKYESYWPVSRSSRNPVDIFLLIPIFDESSKSISSTFFKKKFNDLYIETQQYLDLYDNLKHIAHKEIIDIFCTKHSINPSDEENCISNFQLKEAYIHNKIGCIIADYNVLDNGHINFIKNNLNLTDELIIFVPNRIEHQKIEFNTRYNLTQKIIKEIGAPKIKIIECEELTNIQNISELLKKHKINQLFFEMREYHTRNEQKLNDIFERMKELSENNIDLIITLQEKFRDISQPLIFNISHDEYEAKTPDNQSMLNKYIPKQSKDVIKKFIDDFYHN